MQEKVWKMNFSETESYLFVREYESKEKKKDPESARAGKIYHGNCL